MQWDIPVFATVWPAVIACLDEYTRKTNSPACDSCWSPTVLCRGIFRPQVKTLVRTSALQCIIITQCENFGMASSSKPGYHNFCGIVDYHSEFFIFYFATFQVEFAILHQAIQRWEVLSAIYRTKPEVT